MAEDETVFDAMRTAIAQVEAHLLSICKAPVEVALDEHHMLVWRKRSGGYRLWVRHRDEDAPKTCLVDASHALRVAAACEMRNLLRAATTAEADMREQTRRATEGILDAIACSKRGAL